MSATCIVIEDDPAQREIVVSWIRDLPLLRLVAACPHLLEAQPYLLNGSIDLVFTDIDLPYVDAVTFFRGVQKPPLLVLLTAHIQYAPASYEIDAVDYLVKPVTLFRFLRAVNKALGILAHQGKLLAPEEEEDGAFLELQSSNQQIKLRFSAICYIELLSVGIRVQHQEGLLESPANLLALKEQLMRSQMMRIHKKYWVNPYRVVQHEPGQLTGLTGWKLPVGKAFEREVAQTLQAISA